MVAKYRLVEAVDANTTMADTLRALSMKINGGNYGTLRRLIAELGLDTNHWLGQAHARGKPSPNKGKRLPLDELLVEGSTYKSQRLKERLIEENIFENRCFECGQEPMWNGKTLVLELDHINGVKTDNRLENLRILCGHCHSQTPTFRGRNKRKSKGRLCCDCGTKVSKKATRCVPCDRKSRPRRSN